MNGMDLYRAVGQIDDDLILAANQPPVKNVTKTRLPIRFLAAAACLILAVCGICAHVFRTSVIWNEGPVETLGGFSVPPEGIVRVLSDAECRDYYQVFLPQSLGNDLHRAAAEVHLITDANGAILDDRNQFSYLSADGSKRVTLMLTCLSAVSPDPASQTASVLHGVPVVLTVDLSLSEVLLSGARWEQNGSIFQLSAEGVSRKELISMVKELIACTKKGGIF